MAACVVVITITNLQIYSEALVAGPFAAVLKKSLQSGPSVGVPAPVIPKRGTPSAQAQAAATGRTPLEIMIENARWADAEAHGYALWPDALQGQEAEDAIPPFGVIPHDATFWWLGTLVPESRD